MIESYVYLTARCGSINEHSKKRTPNKSEPLTDKRVTLFEYARDMS